MMSEGIGKKAPAPHAVVFHGYELSHLLVESERREKFRNYNGKSDSWSQGLRGDVLIEGLGVVRQPVRPIFCGLMGEYAVSVFINNRLGRTAAVLDLALRRDGDQSIDLSASGLTLQVKTRETGKHGNLVRYADERGRLVRMTARAHVFCEWTGDRTVLVLGWLWTTEVQSHPIEQAPRGAWRNYVVPDCDLEPPSSLIDRLEADG